MKVIVADKISERGVQMLKETGWNIVQTTKETLAGELADADALIVRSATRVTPELLAKAPRLRTNAHTLPPHFFAWIQLNKIRVGCIAAPLGRKLSRTFRACGRCFRQNSDVRRSHAVPIRIFDQVHGLVCEMQQTLFRS